MTALRSGIRKIVATVRASGPLWTAALILDRVVPYGVLGWWPETRVSAATLAAQVDALLCAWGMSAEHAAVTVEQILYADLRGLDAHGCAMLRHYHRAVVEGSLTVNPTVAVVREDATTALVDGGGGLGHVPAVTAMNLAIAKCRSVGLAAVAVRNSGHYGAAGAYAALAAQAGLIGFATTSTREPAVVPTFGTEARLGTNPIAFAAPAARNPPFLLDMATSTASLGALIMAWRRGRSIPAGWALDARGRPLRGGRAAAAHRRLTPLGSSRQMGSHKGYGLAVAMEILSSVLPGARRWGSGAPVAATVGHFFLAIDPCRFRPPPTFEADLDGLLDALHGCPPADPRHPVLVAGDPEHAAAAERRRNGIPLSRVVIEDLRAIARASGAPFLLGAPRTRSPA